jgi:multiple sugar transport system substrate-binding protein
MPSFPNSVSDFGQIIDIASGPSGRYAVLADVPATLTNLGDPGYSNAATDEVRGNRILSTMFARTAIGETTPREAMDQAAKAVEPIFDKWRDAGKI